MGVAVVDAANAGVVLCTCRIISLMVIDTLFGNLSVITSVCVLF